MEDEVDVHRLADYLRVLANPNRLALLYALRWPRSVGDIELHPEKVAEGENPERPISHQAVRDHLAKLRTIGVVAIERAERDGHVVDQFVLNHPKLFAIVEELRRLGELRATQPVAAHETIVADQPVRAADVSGPRFVIVRGQREGHVFPLTKERLTADRGWVIGRKRGLAVSLDYDPFVSSENAEVVLSGSSYEVMDIRSSRNGTLVNFEPVERGGKATLESGDIVTVGRTNLVFRT